MIFLDVGIKTSNGQKSNWKYATIAGGDIQTLTEMVAKLLKDETVVKVTLSKND